MTMVLKQCHLRLQRFVCNYPVKWYNPFCNEDRVNVSSFVPEPGNSSLITASPLTVVNASPSFQCVTTPAFTNFDKRPWRRRRSPARRTVHVSAVTQMFLRGKVNESSV